MTDPNTTKTWLDVIWPAIDKLGMVALVIIQTVGAGLLLWKYGKRILDEWQEWTIAISNLTKELTKWRERNGNHPSGQADGK